MRTKLDEVAMLSLLSSLQSADALASMDAEGLAAASALLSSDSSAGPTLVIAFTDGYGSCGLRLTATLAQLSRQGTDVVAVNVGGESDVKANGLSHSFAHWYVGEGHSRLGVLWRPLPSSPPLLPPPLSLLCVSFLGQGGVHKPLVVPKGDAGVGECVPWRRLLRRRWWAR
jgi:hypothetical protein